MRKIFFAVLMCVFVLSGVFAGGQQDASAGADDFPNKPITFVIPKGAGGSHDAHARIIERFARDHLGQPLIIELKPGGSGAIGSNYVKDARPDGYTLLFGDNGVNTVLPIVENVGYTRDDFLPVARINYSPTVIVAAPDEWASIDELIADAKKNPGKISYASSGMFNAGHNAFEVFQDAAGITLNHVPMQGGADPQMAVLAGQVPLCGAFADEILDLIAEGQLVALAVMAGERIAVLPDVPTLMEKGLDAEWEMHRTVFAPKGTPPEIIAKLDEGFRGICEDPEFIETIEKMGEEVMYMGHEDFQKFWDKENAKFVEIFERRQ
ncbi:MAG: tripartite tricarboxylate transporter substrate binding protein [Spirochaetota bacterium]|nr:tripartite tricarboxylate transporter substrate binding protein [Spirochaetota bacterium]